MIRPAVTTDIDEILLLQQELIEYERQFNEHTPDDCVYYTRDEITKAINRDDALMLVNEADSLITGTGLIRIEKTLGWDKYDQLAYVGHIYIKPEERGKGLGKEIIQSLLDWAEEKGVQDIQLDVYPENHGVVALYKKLGFEPYTLKMRRVK